MRLIVLERLLEEENQTQPSDLYPQCIYSLKRTKPWPPAPSPPALRLSVKQYEMQDMDDFYDSSRMMAMLANRARPSIHLSRKRGRRIAKDDADELEKMIETIASGAPDLKRLRLTDMKKYSSPKPVTTDSFLMQLVRFHNLQYLDALSFPSFNNYHLELIATATRNLKHVTFYYT